MCHTTMEQRWRVIGEQSNQSNSGLHLTPTFVVEGVPMTVQAASPTTANWTKKQVLSKTFEKSWPTMPIKHFLERLSKKLHLKKTLWLYAMVATKRLKLNHFRQLALHPFDKKTRFKKFSWWHFHQPTIIVSWTKSTTTRICINSCKYKLFVKKGTTLCVSVR